MKAPYKAICLDLDGTVYRGIEPIPEAVEFISRVQSAGIDPYFITNNSSKTQVQLQAKLLSFGIKATLDRIMTSAIATAKYCSIHHQGASVMLIGGDGLVDALDNEGITQTTENPDIVIMGIDHNISYAKLADACLAIRAGAHFIATNNDKAFPTERGLVPGNGSFIALMESATGVQPILIGKPEIAMLGFIQAQGGYAKEEMVMVGDNYDTDILTGIRFGIDTVHVETGVTSKENLLLKEIQPTVAIHTLIDWKI
jgi:4-nitrophenyl phosphatase